MRRSLKRVLGGVLGLVVLVAGGTFLYIHVIEGPAPKKLSLDSSSASTGSSGSSPTSAAAPSGDISGTWQPTGDSQVGYRVNEILFGQKNTAVGRTHKVTGSMVIDGSTVKSVDLTADMSSVASDQARRDAQFHGRIMDVSSFPTATFKLTQPIELVSVPTDTSTVTTKATGDLTLRGTTKPVTIDLQAKRDGAKVAINGAIPITFADWNIPNPGFGPVTTDDHGEIELLVVFQKP